MPDFDDWEDDADDPEDLQDDWEDDADDPEDWCDDWEDYADELEDWLNDWEDYLQDLIDAYNNEGIDCADCLDYFDELQDWLNDYWDYLEELGEELDIRSMEDWEDYLDSLKDELNDSFENLNNLDDYQDWILNFIDEYFEILLESMDDEAKIKACKGGELPAELHDAINGLLEFFADDLSGYKEKRAELLDAYVDAVEYYQAAMEALGETSVITSPMKNSTGSTSNSFGAAQNFLRVNSGLLIVSDSADSVVAKQNEQLARLF